MSVPSEWEALPQRKTRRRLARGDAEPSPLPPTVATAATTAAPTSTATTAAATAATTAAPTCTGAAAGATAATAAKTTTEAATATAGTAPSVATAAAGRHAAVATAVEARSRMLRCCGDLEGGAGADGANFEYLDHTADVQLHSWGDSVERAMESAVVALFNLLTAVDRINVDPALTRKVEAKGHDSKSLLFSLLDEFLYVFHSESLVVKNVTIDSDIDRDSWTLQATAEGETFDMSKHSQGTEVKAITYSNMQINEAPDGRTDIYVIVDI